MNDFNLWKEALIKLRIMLQCLDCFEGTQSHRLVENADHLRRIFDLLLGSTSFEVFQEVLKFQENHNDNSASIMKIEVMKCLIYITIGSKYLASEKGL